MSWAMNGAPVKGASRLILIYMANSSTDTGECIFSSMTTTEMSAATGYSVRKVNAKLDDMIRQGVLTPASGGWELNLTAGVTL